MTEESVDLSQLPVELPPQLEKLVEEIRDGGKALAGKAYLNPAQLRDFIRLNIVEWIAQNIEVIGTAVYDTHKLATSNAVQIQRQRRWMAKHLRSLGVDVSDGQPFAGTSAERLNDFGAAFFALGTYLQNTYAKDAQLGQLFDTVVLAYNALAEDLAGNQEVPDDEEDEPEDEDESKETDGEGDEPDLDDLEPNDVSPEAPENL
jgi:hypothetical protein